MDAGRLFEPIATDRIARRWTQLLSGVVLYGVTAGMLVIAGLGLDPWDVFHQGLSRTFGLAIGTWAIIVSLVVLSAWAVLRQRPGIGTLVYALAIGSISHYTIPALAIDDRLRMLRPSRGDAHAAAAAVSEAPAGS